MVVDVLARKRGDSEMEKLKEMLDEVGIDWEQRGEGTPIVNFRNLDGDCWAFPSQTYDGKMCVRYTRKAWVETAEEALRLCGVVE